MRCCVGAWAAGSWAGGASCLCHCVGQCQFSLCRPGWRVGQHQPGIHQCLPSSVLPFPERSSRVLLFMVVEGLWPPTLHQGKSPAGHGAGLWWHRCGGVPSLAPARQGYFYFYLIFFLYFYCKQVPNSQRIIIIIIIMYLFFKMHSAFCEQ